MAKTSPTSNAWAYPSPNMSYAKILTTSSPRPANGRKNAKNWNTTSTASSSKSTAWHNKTNSAPHLKVPAGQISYKYSAEQGRNRAQRDYPSSRAHRRRHPGGKSRTRATGRHHSQPRHIAQRRRTRGAKTFGKAIPSSSKKAATSSPKSWTWSTRPNAQKTSSHSYSPKTVLSATRSSAKTKPKSPFAATTPNAPRNSKAISATLPRARQWT